MSTKFTPLHDRILVRRVEEEGTTRGGIIIPDSAKDKPQEGEVISAGKGKISEEGKVRPLDVKRATAFCSANTRAPKSSSTAKTSSSCVKKKFSGSSPAQPRKKPPAAANSSQPSALSKTRI